MSLFNLDSILEHEEQQQGTKRQEDRSIIQKKKLEATTIPPPTPEPVISAESPKILPQIEPTWNQDHQQQEDAWDFSNELKDDFDVQHDEDEPRMGQEEEEKLDQVEISQPLHEEPISLETVSETSITPIVATEQQDISATLEEVVVDHTPLITLEGSSTISASSLDGIDPLDEQDTKMNESPPTQDPGSSIILQDALEDAAQDRNVLITGTSSLNSIHCDLETTESSPSLEPSVTMPVTQEESSTTIPHVQEEIHIGWIDPPLVDSNAPQSSPPLPEQVLPPTLEDVQEASDNTPASSTPRITPQAEQIAQTYMLQLERLHTQHQSEIQEYQQRITLLEGQLAKKQQPPPNPIALHDKCLQQLRKLEKEYTLELQQKEDELMQSQLLVQSMDAELTSLKRESHIR